MSDDVKYFLLAAAGGLAVDSLEFYRGVRAKNGVSPILYTRKAFWVSEVLRGLVGGLVGWALYAAHDITTPFGAVTAGISAPIIIGRIAESPPAG